MAIDLSQIRDELLPGLNTLTGSSPELTRAWNNLYAIKYPKVSPTVQIPLSLKAVVLMGAAALMAKNPTVSRRLFGWLRP